MKELSINDLSKDAVDLLIILICDGEYTSTDESGDLRTTLTRNSHFYTSRLAHFYELADAGLITNQYAVPNDPLNEDTICVTIPKKHADKVRNVRAWADL